MPLVVEQGSGKPDAESYASVADTDAYNTDWIGASEWDNLTTDAKERSLRRATRFVDDRDFLGHRMNQSQALDWPRWRPRSRTHKGNPCCRIMMAAR